MPAVRCKNSNNQTDKTQVNLTKEIDIPFGKSYIYYLPDGVLYSTYHYRHQLEFKPTLNMLSKLRIDIDSAIVETRKPITNLLEIATNRKHIY